MKSIRYMALLSAMALPAALSAAIEGSLDPESVVEKWSNASTSPKIIDINFSDTTWPDTWAGETGRDCPEWESDTYVNAIIPVPANGDGTVTYPVVFHNCTFATKASAGGHGGTTAAFAKQYYLNMNPTGTAAYCNNWTIPGHTEYLEDNIVRDANGVPTSGEAGFVQMCRNASVDGVTSLHGWMEIDHIPYVERIQWSWSSTSWGRGIKCDIKIGNADWKPLVWMGSENQKLGWTSFSDQGYFMENIIDAKDVSLRWRVWDGQDDNNAVQKDFPSKQTVDPLAERQAPRVHKLQIFGDKITAEQAKFARENMVNNPGELSDLDRFQGGDKPEPDKDWDEPADIAMKAFPTAEGFGKYASGGRGGKIVKVTSLADDGSEGTLRWAFTQHPGEPLTILFEVSGEIALQKDLRINRANWTLAGQSAPGEGIVITHNKVNVGGSSNFIVRNMRFRIGRMDAAGNIIAANAVGAENCSNFIFDHCSFGWSVEENLNTADSHFLTVQNSIVHEGLYNAGHSKGARGYGAQLGGSPATYHHNLFIHNKNRSPRLNGARGEDFVVFLEYANNVNYNYGKRGGCYGGENTADISSYNGMNSAHECNFMSNYYKPGPESDKSRVEFVKSSYARSGATSWGPAKWYLADNVAEGIEDATADNWKGLARDNTKYTLDELKSTERIIPQNAYYKYSAAAPKGRYTPSKYMLEGLDAGKDVLGIVAKNAGTINPDKVEKRLRDEALNGTAAYGNNGILDREDEAEGFFPYSTDYIVPTDSDNDGLPDEWELKHASSLSEIDNNTVLKGGYTALEVYLNELMGEDSTSAITDIMTDSGNDAPVELYNLQGLRVTNATSPGIYIRRQGTKTEKVIIR